MTRATRRHDPRVRACPASPFALALAGAWALVGPVDASAQTRPSARISEETRILDTYPFSEPDPIPILVSDPRLYPYHAFRGYSATSEPREWKVVKLENDLIEVFVLPEAGGKVWGAVVKGTGHEFIYRNEVMKFRDIALRGPWTSGGIEFNFGVIGHTPATATPVDYLVRENADGSVSCIVGAMDLPSRTHWRVEIRLPPDRGYFETRALWYNPTPLEQPYYNWMTAAAFAQQDLELYVPGGSYLEHSGRERPWPVDEAGRFLPLYRNNDFGGHKSYHVVGELNDFFGGYYHGDGYGWGHWSRYEEMPGQKMWLWALSRQGGVWEDLLTDTDGQYVEFQAGRLLVQYSPGAHVNPVTQAAFDPLSASAWTETWFPLEGTGGLSDASREGAMHVELGDSVLRVVVNAFGDVTDTLRIWAGERLIENRSIDLVALEPYEATISHASGDRYLRVELPGLGLDYTADSRERSLSRPFETDPQAWESIPEADRLVFQARELAKGRRYGESRLLFEEAAAAEPWNRGALLGLADLALRSARYEEGLEHARRVLQLDTYDAAANFVAGNLYRALGRDADARDAFGWSARAVAFRSASYIRLGEIMVEGGKWGEGKRYAELALDFDRNSIPAWQLLAIIGRLSGDEAGAERALTALLRIDPLSHFVPGERYLAAGTEGNAAVLHRAMRSEYPDQTLLELALGYAARGLAEDALAILGVAETGNGGRRSPSARPVAGSDHLRRGHDGPVLRAWRAFLAGDPAALADPGDLAFAFPFRPETLPALRWAAAESGHWAWGYLLGLNLWALDREDEAREILNRLGDRPDFGPAYAARGHLGREAGRDPGVDFGRAVEFDPRSRILRVGLIRYLLDEERWADALQASAAAREIFPGDFNLDLLHARALLNLGSHGEAISVLAATRVLPSENARESHHLYELAHIGAALDDLDAGNAEGARGLLEAALLWPESLGQGRPYNPDERLVRFLLGVAARAAGEEAIAREALEAAAADANTSMAGSLETGDVIAVAALSSLGRGPGLSIDDALARAASDNPEAVGSLEWRFVQRALRLGGFDIPVPPPGEGERPLRTPVRAPPPPS
ncbi:MAG: DUF5107 domain-containing protein [Gemmatimonadota bacterium]|nr:DUF5107 domain-containing protein [Gemmatimonadota bacterium]MDE2985526.1 DUF5107 domain-containing protein [Gemmatimonadota bacterium]